MNKEELKTKMYKRHKKARNIENNYSKIKANQLASYYQGRSEAYCEAYDYLNQLDEPKPQLSGKQWLLDEYHEMVNSPKTEHPLIDAGYETALKDFKEIIDQLDELETLSQEWIDKNIVYADVKGNTEAFLNEHSVRNLLVPKQEITKVPQEWFDVIKRNKDLTLETILRIANPKREEEERFVKAWLAYPNIEVEEEPLYRARLKVITDEFIASYLRTQSSDAEDRLKALEIGSKYIHEDYRHLSEFTEDELKRLGVWDSEQWEVEELEE